jgi:nucleoside-diphosphate-sugar epimerase
LITRKKTLLLGGSGRQYRHFVYIDDIVDALLSVSEKDMGKALVQIGSERATTIQQAAELVAQLSGKDIPIR